MNRRRWITLAVIVLAVAGWVAACSSEDTGPPVTPTGGAAGGGTGGSGTGGILFGGSGPQECTTSADCDGGVCVNGICCDSAENVCGQDCCEGDEVCVFGECVTPGDPCLTSADCPDGWYCEPALGGDSDAGPPDAGPDAVCTQPAPIGGRCLPLPPICGPDAGAGGGCIEPCEYHPPVGQLNAIQEWQWGYDPAPTEYPNRADVWATPAVARIYDANCDGEVNLADPPQLVFVSGNSQHTWCGNTSPPACKRGVLRMLDGASGQEIWSLDRAEPSSVGFAGLAVAVGDIDGDQHLDILAMTGEGYIAMVNAQGQVQHISDQPVEGVSANDFGWGGGISIGDMDGDGLPEIAYSRTLYEWTGSGINRVWRGTQGTGAANSNHGRAISHFVDLDEDGQLELLAGNTAYHKGGGTLWEPGTTGQPDGFTAIGDFDRDGSPEVVLIAAATVRLLNGADGMPFNGWAPLSLPGTGHGGPPTVADFDGDNYPEIGVAQQNRYSMIKPNFGTNALEVVWWATNHDMSSAVTGSSVFDFQGDGAAEVVYNDECYLWVYDGATGNVMFTGFTQSFTATEASMVADVDGDGHAEMLQVANGADPNQWTCAHHDAPGVIVPPHSEAFPVWQPAPGGGDYRGITVLGDAENSWVGTRTLWNQHAYQVTNICDPRDSACTGSPYYGQIPPSQQHNWEVSWLNNFRQNVQDEGLFDAPDAVVSLSVQCVDPVAMQVSVRNIGLSGLPAGIDVEIVKLGTPEVQLGIVTTTIPLMPGQTEVIDFVAPAGQASTNDTFQARIIIPDPPTFHECREDNNESDPVQAECVQ